MEEGTIHPALARPMDCVTCPDMTYPAQLLEQITVTHDDAEFSASILGEAVYTIAVLVGAAAATVLPPTSPKLTAAKPMIIIVRAIIPRVVAFKILQPYGPSGWESVCHYCSILFLLSNLALISFSSFRIIPLLLIGLAHS